MFILWVLMQLENDQAVGWTKSNTEIVMGNFNAIYPTPGMIERWYGN